MSEDISLLPEEMRKREEELKKKSAPPPAVEKVSMHLPDAEQEDIEIIEVDEGEVKDVLAGEPALSRAIFGVQTMFQAAKAKLFHPRPVESPPKLPPQFFKPPVPKEKKPPPGLVPIPGAVPPTATRSPLPVKPAAVAPPAKARIMPAAQTPRRVRVIKRVRKPVRVSFLDEKELQLRIDLPRRKFTLAVYAATFILLFAGTYAILVWQGERAGLNAASVKAQLSVVQARLRDRQKEWASFQDLEPRLKTLGGLLDAHVAPTHLFDLLERHTVPDVSYSSFTLTPEGHAILTASARSYESAARQIVALRDSGMAEQVEALGYQATYDGESGALDQVSFQINLTLRPSVLRAMKAEQVAGAG
ncbi:hypothetical protein HY479_02835 [Candidatus Uhrbacteria bacterium]|nr:hypothetical protein [Candidatus Uhrbacteria bacterium]